jgi:parallel beta-helix repeat protein
MCDLRLKNSNHNLIASNIFRGNYHGIGLDNSSHNTILNNLVDQHQFSSLALARGSSYNLICNNDFSNSVYSGGITNEDNCCYNTYKNNTIHNNGEVGMHIKHAGLGLTIVNNSFLNNGISFESTEPELLSYTIENNILNGKRLYYLKNTNNMDLSDAGQVILIKCSACRILNQTISNVQTGFYGHGGGICLINSTQITIQGNSISGCTPVGIDVYYSNNINISSNILSENYGGISASYSNRNSIVDNVIQHGEDEGISLSRSSGNSIKRNTISDFKRALYLMLSSFNIVTSNQLLNQTYLFWNCVANQFVSNTMQGGIVLETDCSGTTLMYNTISQSYTGISLEYGMLIRIIGNNITNNGKGLQLGTTGFTLVKKNNFINNGIQASFEDTVWSSLFPDVWIQNYWDDFNGSLRYPIQGKYIINHFSWDPDYPIPPTIYQWTKYDWFPAKEPYDIPGMR